MALRYRVPLPGPFYYSGRVGPKHWLPRSSSTGTGPMGFVVKWSLSIRASFSSGSVWLSCLLRSMDYSGWSVVRCGIAGGASCMASFRLSCRFALYPMVSFRPNGSAWLAGVDRSARIGACELGRPLFVSSVGLASCPPSRDRTGWRARSYVAHRPMFWG